MRYLTWIPLAALAACGGGAKADFEKLCNAAELSGADAITDPDEKTVKLTSWIADNIHSTEAIETFRALAVASPETKGKLLQSAATEAGYAGPCPLAAGPTAP